MSAALPSSALLSLGSIPVPPVPDPPALARLSLGAVLVLAALAGWAAFAELDVVSTAAGEVSPATRVKAVQHLEGGILAAILVEEGQSVRRGEPLFRLDRTRAAAEAEELEQRFFSLQADIARLTAETVGAAEPDLTPEVESRASQAAAAARGLFRAHRDRVESELATQANLVMQKHGDMEELRIRLRNTAKSLEISQAQVAISAGLLHKDLTSRMTHLDLLQQEQRLRSSLEADMAALPRLEAALAEARQRQDSIRDNFAEQARRDLALASQQAQELAQRLLRAHNIDERTVVRAPVDGVIKTVSVATEGGVILPGQTLAELVPAEDSLVVEARLPVQDIGYVHPGQSVRLSLATPDASAYGALDGTVVRVGADAVGGANSGGGGTNPGVGEGRAFYRVRIVTAARAFGQGERLYQLHPGMPLMCSIRIGSRSVLEYLLSPWFNTMRFAFQER